MQDIVLYKTHQHKIILFSNFLAHFFKYWIITSIIFIYFFLWIILAQIASVIIILIIFFLFDFYFWSKSYFIISNEKILIKVRNGIFSKYHMNIYYKNIRDMAYSKNNIMHYAFNYGTFFARSSAWATWDFEAKHIPKVEEVYTIINNLFLLNDDERKKVNSLSDLKENNIKTEKKETVIENEKKILESIKWIKEVIVLNDIDRKFIFSHEEDRNHWVYECIKRKVLFCVTHDSNFRDPDSLIVLKLGNKVIFPAVSFHEIKRPSTVSSSPWLDVHNYLIKKFNNPDDYDATILIGFDV